MKYTHSRTHSQGFAPLLIIIAIAAVAAIGGGIYYHAHKKAAPAVSADASASATTTAPAAATSTAGTAATSSASLRTFLSFTGSQKCDVSAETKNGGTTGVVFLHDGKLRGDFTSTISGTAVSSHMIKSGDSVHVWSGSQGAVMLMSAMEAAQSSPKNTQQVTLDQQVSYSCTGWAPDDSQFAVPGSVSFVDVSAMMKAYMR